MEISTSAGYSSVAEADTPDSVNHYELEDVLIYKLSNKLGGRSEVMELPAVEALGYLIIMIENEKREEEEKRWELFMNHVSRINAQQPSDDKQAQAQGQFLESINPMNKQKKADYELEWNFEAMEDLDI